MQRRLRIGYIVPHFPGRAHIFFWREIKALEEMGVDVHVFSTRRPPRGVISHHWSNEAVARTTNLGRIDPYHAAAAITRLIPRGLPGWLLKEPSAFSKDVLNSLVAADRLLSFSRRFELDHIHAHSAARAAFIAALAHHMGAPRYSLTLHGPLSEYGPGQRFKWRNASFATVVTQQLLQEVHEHLGEDMPDRVMVQPLGIDTEMMSRTEPYLPPEAGRPIRLFSNGRLHPSKGHQDLMSATRQLLDQGTDVRLEIAGEDDFGGTGYRKELEEHMKKLRLLDHVKLLGAISPDTVREKLEEAHLFVLASWHEALGMAYMEAMSMGVPTVGTDVGGVKELIQDGSTGYLSEAGNPGQLARTIRALVNDRDALLRLSAEGRAHVEAHFRVEQGARVLIDEITRLREG